MVLKIILIIYGILSLMGLIVFFAEIHNAPFIKDKED